MKAHYATLRVFCGEEEDEAKILEGLKWLIPLNWDEEKIGLKRQAALGFGDRKITIFEMTLEKQKHVNDFIDGLLAKISGQQKKMVLGQLDSRVDGDGNFFIRLDKSAVERKDALVTDSGNCYHIKIKVAAYPSTKAKAIDIARQALAA